MSDSLQSQNDSSQQAAPVMSEPPAKRQRKSGKNSYPAVVEKPNSPLVNANLKAFFANPQTWDILDDKQKSNVLELLPLQAMEQDVDGKFRLSHAFLTNNPDWVSDTSGLQEDIAEGKYNPARMSQAMAAHDTRVQGGFDNFKDEEFEVFWGMKQKLAVGVVAGTSSDVKLTELIREGLILVGDTWSFVRTLHTGGAKILVEKESIVVWITPPNGGTERVATLEFTKGTSKFFHPDGDNVRVEGINGPGKLEAAILKEDPRVHEISNGNAWKTFRVLRKNQDLGTLWDIRQAYHFSEKEGIFKAAMSGERFGTRRTSKTHLDLGLTWANPFVIVFQQVQWTNGTRQVPPSLIPIPVDFEAALDQVALPGCKIFRIDYRVLTMHGLMVPTEAVKENNKVCLSRLLDLGPGIFPTDFTKAVAGRWCPLVENGPSWSMTRGHAGAYSHKTMKRDVERCPHWKQVQPVPIAEKQRNAIVVLLQAHAEWRPQLNLFDELGLPHHTRIISLSSGRAANVLSPAPSAAPMGGHSAVESFPAFESSGPPCFSGFNQSLQIPGSQKPNTDYSGLEYPSGSIYEPGTTMDTSGPLPKASLKSVGKAVTASAEISAGQSAMASTPQRSKSPSAPSQLGHRPSRQSFPIAAASKNPGRKEDKKLPECSDAGENEESSEEDNGPYLAPRVNIDWNKYTPAQIYAAATGPSPDPIQRLPQFFEGDTFVPPPGYEVQHTVRYHWESVALVRQRDEDHIALMHRHTRHRLWAYREPRRWRLSAYPPQPREP